MKTRRRNPASVPTETLPPRAESKPTAAARTASGGGVCGTKCEAKWTGTGQLQLTVGAGVTIAAKNSFANSGTLTYDQTPEDDDVYEIYFVLKNPTAEQSAKAVTVTTEGFKADGVVNSGLTSSRRSLAAIT